MAETIRIPEPAHVPSSRERILAAAKKLFAEHGYDNTSTVAIARAAGTSESQLMKHFGSKEGLLEAIFDRGWAAIGEMFRTVQMIDSPSEKLEATLDTIITVMERDAELKELMLLEGRRIRKEGHMIMLTAGYRKFIGMIDSLLAEMRMRGELRGEIPNEAIRSALTAMVEGLLRDQVLAARMKFPASYDSAAIKRIFKVVLASLAQTAR